MVDQIRGPGPAQPQGPLPQPESSSNTQAMAAWNQMFGGMATEKELKQMMDQMIKDALRQIKKDEAKMIEAIKKMRRDAEELEG